jgi:hypothetical protein
MGDAAPQSQAPSQYDRLTLVKFARYAATTAAQLSERLQVLCENLEQVGILDPNRRTRVSRDQELRTQAGRVALSHQAVTRMVELLAENPSEPPFQDLDLSPDSNLSD